MKVKAAATRHLYSSKYGSRRLSVIQSDLCATGSFDGVGALGVVVARERMGEINESRRLYDRVLTQIVPMSTNSSEKLSLPTDKELVLKVIPMPADSNANGDIFGGWVMAQVDLAGSVIPARIAKGRITTVAVNEFLFKQPVKIGDLLSFYAEVVRIGNTSVTVHVEVYAQRLRQADQTVKVTDANLTYVAIDMEGKPRQIPKD